MKVTKIRIGGKMFILDPDQDVDALEKSIATTAASGSGFVKFQTAGHVTVSALVTPYLPVRISVIDHPGDEPYEPADDVDSPLGADTHFDG